MVMAGTREQPGGSRREGDPAGESPSWREADGVLDQEAARFLYRWGGRLSETLVRIRSRFHGDLDQYLLYLVFILSEISASGNGGSIAKRRGLNALSLSEITQIPRETARRKLLALAEDGYLRRDSEGLYYLGDAYGVEEVFEDLKPLFWDAARGER
jgi:hypothetical protein